MSGVYIFIMCTCAHDISMKICKARFFCKLLCIAVLTPKPAGCDVGKLISCYTVTKLKFCFQDLLWPVVKFGVCDSLLRCI